MCVTPEMSPFYLEIIHRSVLGKKLLPTLWFPWWHIFPKPSWHHLVFTPSLLVEEWLIWWVNLGGIAFLLCACSPLCFSGSKLPTKRKIGQHHPSETVAGEVESGGWGCPSQAALLVTERPGLSSLNPVSKSGRLSHGATTSIWFLPSTDCIFLSSIPLSLLFIQNKLGRKGMLFIHLPSKPW